MIRRPINPARVWLLAVGVAVLVIGGATGLLRSCSGVDVDADEAVEIARPHINFEPTDTNVRMVRQGFPGRPTWAVVFSIPDPSDPTKFSRLTAVRVDGRTGQVIQVEDRGDEPD